MLSKSALLVGATGLVGREILHLLIDSTVYSRIIVLARRPLDVQSEKVTVQITDFSDLDRHPEWFAVDTVFCALGTTIKIAGSQEAFRKVDYEYPLRVARLAKAAGAETYALVSVLGADAKSSIFYNRVKGELETELKALGFPMLLIAQPSLLLGERAEFRLGEVIASWFAPLTPEAYKPVHVRQVAKGLVLSASDSFGKLAASQSQKAHRHDHSGEHLLVQSKKEKHAHKPSTVIRVLDNRFLRSV